jgi:hypothetical protein
MDNATEARIMRLYRAREEERRFVRESKRICPMCRHEMNGKHYSDLRRSRDHILPREWGGRDWMWKGEDGATRNIRTMCAGCNSKLATSGHCVGAMACILAVCRDDLADFFTVYHRWGMGKVRESISPRGG